MGYLNKYIIKYWKSFLAAVIFLSLEAACDLIQPTIMAKIVDVGVKNKDLDYVFKLSMSMIVVTGVGAIGATIRNIISGRVSQQFGADLRIDLFKKINSLSFEQLNSLDGASLITRLTNDVTQMQNFFNRLMRIFIKAPILCIGSLIISFRLNYRLALIFIVIIPIVIFLIILNMKISYPFYLKMQSALDKVNRIIREYLSGVRVVKAFNRFDYEEKRFNVENENLANISKKALKVNAFFSPTIGLTVNIGIVLVIWIGGIGVNNGTIHTGEIIAFINYMTKILFSLIMISTVFMTFIKAKASAERIGEVFEVNDLKEEVNKTIKYRSDNNLEEKVNTSNNKGINKIKGKISFNNVNFSYNDETNEAVLSNITFTCESGETLGIIGSTGAGKTTLMNLICGFYRINSGSIKIDDIDINKIDKRELRNSIGIIPQKVLLFSGTIIDNIRWGKEDATLEEVIEVCKIAQIHDLIESLPEKYDTMLGQGGVNLSGGQKQRISIARALIRKPRILIMDDCTSALDGTTESKIKEGIRTFSENLTCITITQRISSVKDSDKILVIEDGHIVDIGTHDELKNKCSVYRDIIKSQFGQEGIS